MKRIWKEFKDVVFDEDQDGEFVLSRDWKQFLKGTLRSDIWSWFDEHSPYGVGALMEGR